MARVRVRDNLNFGIAGPTDDFVNGEGSYGNWAYEPETCKQCGDAACMNICPMQAISVSEHGGARVIDPEKCVGCGACVQACPWHMPRVNPETRKATKCINCGMCVRGCPTSALTMIPWEDVAEAML
jgi:Fe-S-cluster-containing dehydrogenase component